MPMRVLSPEEKFPMMEIPGPVLIDPCISPKGYTCKYVKDPPCELRADVKQFDKSLDALVAVLFAKVRFPIQCRSTNLRFCIIHILSFL